MCRSERLLGIDPGEHHYVERIVGAARGNFRQPFASTPLKWKKGGTNAAQLAPTHHSNRQELE